MLLREKAWNGIQAANSTGVFLFSREAMGAMVPAKQAATVKVGIDAVGRSDVVRIALEHCARLMPKSGRFYAAQTRAAFYCSITA